MDALAHVLTTSAVSGSPLAIVASAIATGYRSEGAEKLRQSLPVEYRAMALGVESHIITNACTHKHRLFLAMQAQARPVLTANGIRDIFSHIAVESAIDCLLSEQTENLNLMGRLWQAFDWEAAEKYLPTFSSFPERARAAISRARKRPEYEPEDYAAMRLHWLARRNNPGVGKEACVNTLSEIAGLLRNGGGLYSLISDAQQELRKQDF